MTHQEVMNYCEKIIANLHDFERHEPFIPNCPHDVAVAVWVIRQLATPGPSPDSERVLSAIIERRKEVAAERRAERAERIE